jgi:hypothetical protein
MRARAAAVQGGLAVLGLAVAHLTWQREPERAPGEVIVVDASKSDLGHVRFEDGENIFAFERRSEGGEPVVWLHLEEKAQQPQPAKVGDPKPPPLPPKTPARDVRGNADALKLFDRFAPLASPRAFGVMEKAKLTELGLDAPTRHLELVVRGDVRKYDVGVAMNAQNGEAFLRDNRDNRVYLMPRGLLVELGNGKRYVDPRLHTFDSKEYDHVLIAAGGKKRDLVHLGGENFSTETYASAKTPDKRDQLAKNWHDSIWRTFPMEVLGKDELPKREGAKLEPRVRLDYFQKGKPVGWLEISELVGGETASGTVTDNLYARSEHTVGWTKLHAPPDVVREAAEVAATP